MFGILIDLFGKLFSQSVILLFDSVCGFWRNQLWIYWIDFELFWFPWQLLKDVHNDNDMQDPTATMQDYHPHHAQAATDFGSLTGGSTGGIPMSPGAGSDPVQSPQPMSPVSGPVSPVSPMSPGALSPRVVDGLPARPALLDSFGKSVGRIQGILHDISSNNT